MLEARVFSLLKNAFTFWLTYFILLILNLFFLNVAPVYAQKIAQKSQKGISKINLALDLEGCVEAKVVTKRVQLLAETYSIAKSALLSVATSRMTGDKAYALDLRWVRSDGHVVLDRHFSIRKNECAMSSDLIETVLRSFLESFPKEDWAPKALPIEKPMPNAPPKVMTIRPLVQSALNLHPFVGSALRLSPTGVDLEAGLTLDWGTAGHRPVTSLVGRLSAPRALGEGYFFEGAMGLGLGWRYSDVGLSQLWTDSKEISVSRSNFYLGVEARVGALAVSGVGYPTNYHTWLLWLEVQMYVAFRLSALQIGPQFSFSPLTHTISTRGGRESQVARARFGVIVWY